MLDLMLVITSSLKFHSDISPNNCFITVQYRFFKGHFLKNYFFLRLWARNLPSAAFHISGNVRKLVHIWSDNASFANFRQPWIQSDLSSHGEVVIFPSFLSKCRRTKTSLCYFCLCWKCVHPSRWRCERRWKLKPHPSHERGMSTVSEMSELGVLPSCISSRSPVWQRGWLCKALRARAEQRFAHAPEGRCPGAPRCHESRVFFFEAFLPFCFVCVRAEINRNHPRLANK